MLNPFSKKWLLPGDRRPLGQSYPPTSSRTADVHVQIHLQCHSSGLIIRMCFAISSVWLPKNLIRLELQGLGFEIN